MPSSRPVRIAAATAGGLSRYSAGTNSVSAIRFATLITSEATAIQPSTVSRSGTARPLG
jgi:hypothetical protein